MTLSVEKWHERFRQQARWTQDLRQHLYRQVNLENAKRILDVGCGTGALLDELGEDSSASIHGVDLDQARLRFGQRQSASARITLADAHQLPYGDDVFDIALCHFLLLWVSTPRKVIEEMARVTQPGCAILIFAEPDYGGRIDHPAELSKLGEWQREALRIQGADPMMGRKLAGLLVGAGLQDVETGVLGGQWQGGISPEERELEWEVIRSDLGELINQDELERLYDVDLAATTRGERTLFVPTFYGWGRVS